MNLLVTGGAGFIGSNFIRFILNNYHDISIVNYDLLTYAGNLKNLEGVEEQFYGRYKFVHGDICDRNTVRDIFHNNKFTAVAHLAAESHVDRSIQSSDVFVRTNVLGTQILLDVALEFQVERFLYVSTDEVYGALKENDLPWTEESPILPNNPYSASKAGAECLARSYLKTYNLPVVITRSSDNYGPYQFPEKFIPLCISNAIEGKPIPLYGDGSNIRDWVYVEDNCRALSRVLLKGQPGSIYNIGSNNQKRNREVAELILESMGKTYDLIHTVSDRKGHDYKYAMDCRKIQKELGWKTEVSFEDGIKRTIEWYLGNGEWVRDCQKSDKVIKKNRMQNAGSRD